MRRPYPSVSPKSASATTSPNLGTELFWSPGLVLSGTEGMTLWRGSMRKSSLAALGAAFWVGATALPAKADVHQIGSVNVAADHFTDISWEHFEGAVERLQFVAQ